MIQLELECFATVFLGFWTDPTQVLYDNSSYKMFSDRSNSSYHLVTRVTSAFQQLCSPLFRVSAGNVWYFDDISQTRDRIEVKPVAFETRHPMCHWDI